MPSSQDTFLALYGLWICLNPVQAAADSVSFALPVVVCWVLASFATANLLVLEERWVKMQKAARCAVVPSFVVPYCESSHIAPQASNALAAESPKPALGKGKSPKGKARRKAYKQSPPRTEPNDKQDTQHGKQQSKQQNKQQQTQQRQTKPQNKSSHKSQSNSNGCREEPSTQRNLYGHCAGCLCAGWDIVRAQAEQSRGDWGQQSPDNVQLYGSGAWSSYNDGSVYGAPPSGDLAGPSEQGRQNAHRQRFGPHLEIARNVPDLVHSPSSAATTHPRTPSGGFCSSAPFPSPDPLEFDYFNLADGHTRYEPQIADGDLNFGNVVVEPASPTPRSRDPGVKVFVEDAYAFSVRRTQTFPV